MYRESSRADRRERRRPRRRRSRVVSCRFYFNRRSVLMIPARGTRSRKRIINLGSDPGTFAVAAWCLPSPAERVGRLTGRRVTLMCMYVLLPVALVRKSDCLHYRVLRSVFHFCTLWTGVHRCNKLKWNKYTFQWNKCTSSRGCKNKKQNKPLLSSAWL